jgi:thioredoxin reductase
MRHQIELSQAKAHEARSLIAASHASVRKESKKLEVVTQDGVVYYAVSDHGKVVLRVGNIEAAVNAYNEL